VTAKPDFKKILTEARLPERTVAVRLGEESVDFRLRALSHNPFRALIRAHTKAEEINLDTAMPALLRACTVEPVLDDDTWTTLLDDTLTDGQYQVLTDAAWALCRGPVT
jgi:hypothetical protein